jgi:hypothetical protein
VSDNETTSSWSCSDSTGSAACSLPDPQCTPFNPNDYCSIGAGVTDSVDYFGYYNLSCNQSTTLTLAAAACVTFYQCTYAGITKACISHMPYCDYTHFTCVDGTQYATTEIWVEGGAPGGYTANSDGSYSWYCRGDNLSYSASCSTFNQPPGSFAASYSGDGTCSCGTCPTVSVCQGGGSASDICNGESFSTCEPWSQNLMGELNNEGGCDCSHAQSPWESCPVSDCSPSPSPPPVSSFGGNSGVGACSCGSCPTVNVCGSSNLSSEICNGMTLSKCVPWSQDLMGSLNSDGTCNCSMAAAPWESCPVSDCSP